MLRFDPTILRDILRVRGVALNPPATADAIAERTRWAGNPLHADVVELLRKFDGFSNGDFEAQSFVSVRAADKAIADDSTKRPMPAFSDWGLDAMTFGFDPTLRGPALSIEDSRQVAPTYRDFRALLLSDRLLRHGVLPGYDSLAFATLHIRNWAVADISTPSCG